MLAGRGRVPREKIRVIPKRIDLARLPGFSVDRAAARAAAVAIRIAGWWRRWAASPRRRPSDLPAAPPR